MRLLNRHNLILDIIDQYKTPCNLRFLKNCIKDESIEQTLNELIQAGKIKELNVTGTGAKGTELEYGKI